MKTRTIFVVYFTPFLPICLPLHVRVKLRSQKLILVKISNNRPFLKVKVVGAYLMVGAYSRVACVQTLLAIVNDPP